MILFTPPSTENTNPFDVARFNFTWRLCTVLAFVFLALSLIYAYKKDLIFIDYFVTFVFSIFILLYQYKTRKYQLSYHIIAFIGTFFPLLTIYTMSTYIHYSSFFWITCIMLITFFGLGVRKGMILVFIDIVGFAFYIFGNLNENISQILPLDSRQQIALIFELATIAILLGYLFYSMITLYKGSEKKLIEMNNSLDERYQEKIVLIKEVHHRVKNNLQIIISLLRMQRDELSSEEAKEQFSEAINRIMAMSLIHGKLYVADDLSKIDVNTYVNELFDEIQSVFDHKRKIDIDTDIQIDALDLQTTVSVGLLLNELISNSFKHAFNHQSTGVIRIEMRLKSEDVFKLKYSDNGPGFQLDEGERSGFGVELIDLLTEQLEGKKKFISSENGSKYSFTLKTVKST